MIPSIPKFNLNTTAPRKVDGTWRQVLMGVAICAAFAMWVMGHKGGYIQEIGLPACDWLEQETSS